VASARAQNSTNMKKFVMAEKEVDQNSHKLRAHPSDMRNSVPHKWSLSNFK
jgi:hypothetical protein